MSDRERQGEVGQRQARLLGERDELLDGVETALVVEVLEEAGAAEFVLLALADAPCEQSLPERAPRRWSINGVQRQLQATKDSGRRAVTMRNFDGSISVAHPRPHGIDRRIRR